MKKEKKKKKKKKTADHSNPQAKTQRTYTLKKFLNTFIGAARGLELSLAKNIFQKNMSKKKYIYIIMQPTTAVHR